MKSSFMKNFEAKKIGKNKSLGKKSYARRTFMKNLKSIWLAEVDNLRLENDVAKTNFWTKENWFHYRRRIIERLVHCSSLLCARLLV